MGEKFYDNNKLMNNKINSSQRVKQFYQNVIEDFGKRLILRYDGREQGIDSEIIDQLKKKLKDEIARSKSNLFNAALETKHYSSTSLVRQTSKNSIGNGQFVKKQETQQKLKAKQQQDYLDLFDNDDIAQVNPVDQEDIVKKQQISPQEPVKIEQNGIMDHQDDRDDEEDRQKQKQTERLKKNLIMHIIGTYQPKSKKHIAKDQSTKLELDDVFIQYKQTNEEIYCHKLVCQFKKD